MAGYEVVGETGRGDEAVQLVDEHRPDLAIFDIKMPGMDGLRAARRDHGAPPGGRAAPHGLQPARPDRRGPGRGGVGLPGQAVPAPRSCCRPSPACWPRPGRSGPSRPRDPSATTAAEDKIATRRLVDQAKQVLMDRDDLTEDGGVRLHPAHGHADPGPDARRGPTGRRRHADP